MGSINFEFYGDGFMGNRGVDFIDSKEVELAFKKYKRELLDVFMLKNGFKKYKNNSYIRLNDLYFVEYVDLQKEHYGSKTFTVNVSRFPLYVPVSTTVDGVAILPLMGKRLGNIIAEREFWWDYYNYDVAFKSFKNIVDGMEKYLLPWFERYNDEQLYLDGMLKVLFKDGRNVKEITHLHLKNNQIQLARDFLNYLHSSDFGIKLSEKRKNIFYNSLKNMSDLVSGIDNACEYINGVMKKNIIDLKLPISFNR